MWPFKRKTPEQTEYEKQVNALIDAVFPQFPKKYDYKEGYLAKKLPSEKDIIQYVTFLLDKKNRHTSWFFGGEEYYLRFGYTKLDTDIAVCVLRKLGYRVEWTSIKKWEVYFL